MLLQCKEVLDDEADQQLCLGCFKHLASRPDAELRRACAGQLAGVLKACKSPQVVFSQQLADTLYSLSTDVADEEVRHTMATTFHEVASQLGKPAGQLLLKPLLALLKDINPDVSSALLPKLPVSLGAIVSPDDPKTSAASAALQQAILQLEASAGRRWRLQADLASAFTSFPSIFDSDVIVDQFLPVAYRLATDSAAAVQAHAAEAIIAILCATKSDRKRADIFTRLIRDYARAKPCFHRMAFVEMCFQCEKKCGGRFVKEYVLDLCLELLKDPGEEGAQGLHSRCIGIIQPYACFLDFLFYNTL